MSLLLHSGSSLRYGHMQETTQPRSRFFLVLSETSRKTIPDIDTESLNCNQNKRAYFAAINPVYWLWVQSDAWKKKYCAKAEENG